MPDLLASVKHVVLLENRVVRLDVSVEALTAKVSDTRDRVIRLEGLLEGAIRTYRPEEASIQKALTNASKV